MDTQAALPSPFVKLAWANLFAQAAEQLSLAACPIIAVLLLAAGPGEIGLLASAQTLPFLLFSIPLGLLADRVSRQKIMVLSECIRTLALIGLVVSVVLNVVSMQVGATMACYGVGMITGALLASSIIKRLSFGLSVLIGPWCSVMASMAMLATLWAPSGWLAGLSYFLFGAGPIIWTITSTTLRQTITPSELLGRVGSMMLTVNFGIRPLGAALGGLNGSQWGEASCLAASLAMFVLQSLVITFSAVRQLKVLPQ